MTDLQTQPKRSPFRGWHYNWWKPSEDAVKTWAFAWHFAGIIMSMCCITSVHQGGWGSPWWVCALVIFFGVPALWGGLGIMAFFGLRYLVQDFRPSLPSRPHIPPPFTRSPRSSLKGERNSNA